MADPEEVLRKAARHLELAQEAKDPTIKRANLGLAQFYHRLFAQALKNQNYELSTIVQSGEPER